MGRKKFFINLPSHFGKKTHSNFNLDKKFFEFSDYFLIENYSVDFLIVVEKKNSFLQLDIEIKGLVNTYCDKCGDPLNLRIKTNETFFLKKKTNHNPQLHNVIYLNHLSEQLNVESVLKESLVFAIPKTKIHPSGECNLDVLKELEKYQKKNNKNLFSDYLKKKLKK